VKRILSVSLALVLLLGAAARVSAQAKDGWQPLFDGKSLTGWKASDNPASFSVADGTIVVNAVGGNAHLYYDGPVQNHDFKNFELKLDIMTFPGANSGVYIHTAYQDKSWPAKGYEVQVNNSHTDPKRTGGLYNVQDVFEPPAKDNEWFTMDIKVEGKHVTVSVNDKKLVDYTEPADVKRSESMTHVLSSGTIALQAHDPKSKVLYKNILIKPLP
jgi:3-keto-disaccharide hydrolase